MEQDGNIPDPLKPQLQAQMLKTATGGAKVPAAKVASKAKRGLKRL